MEKLTTRPPDCSRDRGRYNSENGPRRNGTNGPWNCRLTEPETTKDSGQTTDDQFQDGRQRRLCRFCTNPLWFSPQWWPAWGSRPVDRRPPPPVAGIWNKANFLGLLIRFWAVSRQTPHLSVTVSWTAPLPVLTKKNKVMCQPDKSYLLKQGKTLACMVLGFFFSLK